jgi:hypothetical protein
MTLHTAGADTDPGQFWHRVVVDIPGIEFEPKPPRSPLIVRADTECDGWSTAGATLRSASLRGDRHRYYGQPRQDSVCSCAHDGTGAVVFAVADGVSNAEASEIGAVDACHAAVQAIMSQLDHAGSLDYHAVTGYAVNVLRRRASTLLKMPSPPEIAQVERLLATTLVAGVAWPGQGELTAELFRVGDSGAWILDRANGGYRALFGPSAEDGLGIVSTAVTALPRVPPTLDQVTERVSGNQVLLVGTDGFGVPLGSGDGQIGALFARHLMSPPSPLWLAHVLDFSRETFDDDRTLLALWPRGGGPYGGKPYRGKPEDDDEPR